MTKTRKTIKLSLLEIIILTAIIAIIVWIVFPRFQSSSQDAKLSIHDIKKQTINAQIELYYFHFNRYPTHMTEVGWGTGDRDGNSKIDWEEYWPEGLPTQCNYNQTWEIDPKSGRIKLHHH